MHRAGLASIALLGSWIASHGIAEAQEIVVGVSSFTGRSAGTFDLADLANTNASPIGLDECDSVITFELSGLDSSRDHVEFFEGSMCPDPSVRQDETTTTCDPLEVPDAAYTGTVLEELQVTVSDLLAEPCADGSGSGTRNIWMLALSSPDDDASGPGQSKTFPLAFDFSPPATPGSLQATGGEDVATLTWGSSDTDARTQVFVDPAGCTGGTPTSEGLMSDPPTLAPFATVTGGTTTVAFPESVPFGGHMAVAIRAVDDAGNAGALSNIVCVERFETTSWWDMRCGGDGGAAADEVCRDDGGTCSVASPGRPGSGALAALLGLALAAIVLRRSAR